jgi:hypothetical protein
MFRLLACGVLVTVLAGAAAAQQPAAARSKSYIGKLTVMQWPQMEFDGKSLRAAPGARIVNVNKLTVTPNRVPPGTRVRIEFNDDGQVRLIQLLGG